MFAPSLHPPADSQRTRMIKLASCTVGIMIFFLVYGVTQEKLMTRPYGENGDRFKDTAFLVLINRLVSMAFAASFIYFNYSKSESFVAVAPARTYAFISLSNFMATFCQYEALKYVTFPTQTLGKCAKMIPVLVLGVVVQKKKYSWREFAVALCVMMGCTIFLTTGDIASKKGASGDTPFGLLLIIGYLACDGFTSTTQERLFRHYKTSTYNQMFYVNAFSAILGTLVLVFPFGSESRLVPAFQFAYEHPAMLFDALTLSACSSFGQLVIYYTIKEFGALIYSTIMTTRQFMGVLLSALIFMHPITASQWFGASIVFASLWAKTWISSRDSKSTRHDKVLRSSFV
eukprot:Partr_v1_DN26135_c0_g1_i2_m10800 putative solute carrier family 35 member